MKKILLLLSVLLLGSQAYAQLPYIVKSTHPAGTGGAISITSNYTNVNGILYFTAGNPFSMGAYELWKSNGTAAGTVMVKNFPNNPRIENLTNVNGTVYFTATDGANGIELWKSDGTAAGTVMVKDINPGSGFSYPDFLTNVNGILYFSATDGTNGGELWKSDGTVAGTVMVKDIDTGSNNSSSPTNLTNVNGILYFTADDGTNGEELWKSDGSVAGTVMVKDIATGSNSSLLANLTNVNGILFFGATVNSVDRELWKSDGTVAGTVMVKDIQSGRSGSSPSNLTNVNGILYLVANDGTNGNELWKSDGTVAGTIMVKDIWIGGNNSSPANLTNVNGTLYFRATDGTNVNELWKSDGTVAGTIMVGGNNSWPANLTNVNGILYFTAYGGTNGEELWKSDGTVAGTIMVKGIGTTIANLTNVNGILYFGTYNNMNFDGFGYGLALWKLGTCTVDNALTISPSNTMSNRSTAYNSQQQASPATQSCHCDIYNNLVATVNATGSSPVSSSLDNVKVWIEPTQPVGYLKRHYEIAPSIDPTTATGRVTLYFTQQEFNDFNNQTPAPDSLLPTGPGDATGIANLKIEKRGGVSGNLTGLPGSYTGAVETIDPINSYIVWNSTQSRWEITFDVTGFGGFFVKTPSLCVVPVAYNVTGGGAYCTGGSGVPVGLAGSETDVTYQLINGGSNIGSPVSGSGSAISFGSQTAVGTYTVLATKATGGCTATMTGSQTVSISIVTSSISNQVAVSCFGGTNGGFTVTASGGTSPYQFNRGTGNQTSGIFANVAASTYTVIVTDNNGCSATTNITITQQTPVNITVTSSGELNCTNTSVRLIAAGANTYLWSSSNTSNTVTVTTLGLYTVTGTFQNGCTASGSVTVTSNRTIPPAFQATSNQALTNANFPATITIANYNPNIYSYRLVNFTSGGVIATFTSASITNATGGTFRVECISRANGCTSYSNRIKIIFDPYYGFIVSTSGIGIVNRQSNGNTDYPRTIDGEVLVYPNPVSDILRISYSFEMDAELTFTIYSSDGRLIWTQISNGINDQLQVDVNSFVSGQYFLRVTGKDFSEVKTIHVLK